MFTIEFDDVYGTATIFKNNYVYSVIQLDGYGYGTGLSYDGAKENAQNICNAMNKLEVSPAKENTAARREIASFLLIVVVLIITSQLISRIRPTRWMNIPVDVKKKKNKTQRNT